MEHVQRLDDQSVDQILQAKPAKKTIDGKTITTPFPSPADWRDQWIYFLMVDRFNNPNASPEHADPYLPEHMARHYEYRQEVLREISSSHGDASSHYVTFLDNHDLNERFGAWISDEQVKIGLTCLLTMIGVPCIYYGTEQGLRGSGDNREHSREALWGHAQFDTNHPFYQHIKTLAELRKDHPPLAYGRQYFRACSGDGTNFGHSPYAGGVIAFSRILNTSEILIVANTSTTETQHLHVIVDRHLNTSGYQFRVIHTNQSPSTPPDPVANTGHKASVLVRLKPMEAQVLA